jgi:hypothetical protein
MNLSYSNVCARIAWIFISTVINMVILLLKVKAVMIFFVISLNILIHGDD